jgi:hypothetical protein
VTTINPQQEPQFDIRGCVSFVVENVVFFLGMVLMFTRTSDLMTAFAPATLFGYTGVETAYGFAVACLVEGALFVMKLTLSRAKNVVDWLWNVVVVIAPFLISALAQIIDSFQVKQTLTQQPPSIQLFVAYFVPSVPSLIVVLLIGKSIFSTMPAELSLPWSIAKSEPAPQVWKGKTPVVGRFVLRLPDWLKRGKPKQNPIPADPEKTKGPQ